MPLLPIDLQTMFNQMSLVGREASVQREGSAQYQFLQGTEMARKTEQEDEAVNQTRQLGEGLEKVRDERQRRRRRQSETEAAAQKAERSKESTSDLFDDPDLGHHVDLVG